MDSIVEIKKSELAALCRRYSVSRLYLFGSAADGRFDPDRSDLDFVASMAGREPTGAYADRFLDFADALERLFGRRVDLITEDRSATPTFAARSRPPENWSMDNKPAKLLFDIQESGQAIELWRTGRTFADYSSDRQFRRAVEREFEIIGEALQRLARSEPAVAEKISNLSRIVGFRNRIIRKRVIGPMPAELAVRRWPAQASAVL